MELIVNNKLITTPIVDIIKLLREETGNKYFQYIGEDGTDDIKVTCPFQKEQLDQDRQTMHYPGLDGFP